MKSNPKSAIPERFKPQEFEAKWPRKKLTSRRSPSAGGSRGAFIQGKQMLKPGEYELKWQKVWEQEGIYSPDLRRAQKPYYNLMMFPYPSAEGLHIGNVYAFTGVDIHGRFMRMQGHDVFEPMGLDGFGIHSENYALKVNRHPKEQAKISQINFYRQLRAIGNAFDWSRALETYDPDYYRWTQWLFVKMFKHGLAYRARAAVNYCPSCKTVLADEQVIDGKCERCSSVVIKKDLEQWFFRITSYAERLLQNTYKSTFNWSEKVKIGQRNWIGRSAGVRIEFKVQSSKFKVEVFTTAHDTTFAVTFMVLSPEHPLVLKITNPEYIKQVKDYINKCKKASKVDKALEGEKSGVFTGAYAVNPLNQEKIPIWIADYVLVEYGTGAIMGVPGHDIRDHEFAQKYNLPVKPVIKPKQKVSNEANVEPDGFWDYEEIKRKFSEDSEIFSSGFLNGLNSNEAKIKLEKYVEEKQIGIKEVHYHLRDWLISRQRYWGAPIPMIYCEKCAKEGKSWFTSKEAFNMSFPRKRESIVDGSPTRSGMTNEDPHLHKDKNIWVAGWPASKALRSNAGWYPVPEDQLPILLPDVADWRPTGTGRGPLAGHPEFYKTSCPHCGAPAARETDVCDTFLDSSWYYLRYPMVSKTREDKDFLDSQASSDQIGTSGEESLPTQVSSEASTMTSSSRSFAHAQDDNGLPWDNEINRRWLPVDSYIGGAEHTVLHLLYTRFVWMALRDWDYLKINEPQSGEYDPNEPFKRFFAHGLIIKDGVKMSKSKGNVVVPDDYIRLYGVDTLRSYLMFLGPFDQGGDFRDSGIAGMYRWLSRVWRLVNETVNNQENKSTSDHDEAQKMLAKTIKAATEELSHLRFNTTLAKLMEYTNWWMEHRDDISLAEVKQFLLLLAPFAPHLAEELFQKIQVKGEKTKFQSIHTQPWPTYDAKLVVSDTVTLVVQVNGKVREMIDLPVQTSKLKARVEQLAKQSAKTQKWLANKPIKQIIFIPGKLINFVI